MDFDDVFKMEELKDDIHELISKKIEELDLDIFQIMSIINSVQSDILSIINEEKFDHE